MKSKRILATILGGIGLFLFIVGSSYTWYLIFNRNITVIANLEMKIQDYGKGVSIKDATPSPDLEGKSYEPYLFEVANKGEGLGRYQLSLEELSPDVINDGCDTESLLTKDQLKYQLLLNDKEIQFGYLSSVKNSILLTSDIKGNEEHHYELRVWLSDEKKETNWSGKHYHYRINIKTVTMKEG